VGAEAGDDKTPTRRFILPEFLLEMYLTPSQAPEARRRRRKRRDRAFISLVSTGTFWTQWWGGGDKALEMLTLWTASAVFVDPPPSISRRGAFTGVP